MKTLLLALLAILPLSAHAAISRVQVTNGHGASGTALTATFSTSVSTHDVIVVQVAVAYGSGQCAAGPSSETDTAGDTPITATTWKVFTGDWCMGEYLFVVGAGGSSFQITINFASSVSTWTVNALDYSGVNTTTPIDGASTIATGTNTSPAVGSALTPSQTGDQELGFLVTNNSTTISSWANTLALAESNSTGFQAATADALLSSTSAVTPGASLSGSVPWMMGGLLLKPAGGGASCTHAGITSAGAIAIPNGSSGSYRLKNGSFGAPDCSTVSYFQTIGNFGVN